MAAPPPEAKPLPSPPTDGITALSFIPESNILASTSWDGCVRMHDADAMSPLLCQTPESGPLLSLATPVAHADTLLAGGMDGSVRKLDIPTSTFSVVGRHSPKVTQGKNAVSCLHALEGSLVASAGWDSQFNLWDVRTSGTAPLSSLSLPAKAFCMDYDASHNRIVVCTAGRKTCIIDVRGGKVELVLERDSSLKYQTRCVQFFPKGVGLALGSIEGRVAVEFLEDLGIPADRKKYAFKCHRVGDTVYPVNCINFHPKFGTFATGGCDGTVVLWDGWNKKKLTSLPKFPTSIAALAFNHDGSKLAIASSYTWEEGEREHPRDEIYVRTMLDAECQPKTVGDN
jgi:cell cycle arrest protein BUB3